MEQHQALDLLETGRGRVLEQASTVKKLSEKVAKDLDSESVHQLRVSTRRLSAGLSLLKVKKKELKELKAELGALRKALGIQRQLDVAIENARAYGLDTAPIKYLRSRAGRKVQKRLDGLHRQELSEHLESVLKREELPDAKQLRKRLEKELEFCKKAKKNWPEKKAKRHQLRIRLKKTRYLLEALGEEPKKLKKVHDAMGKARDLRALRDWAKDNAEIKKDENRAWKEAEKNLKPALEETVKAAKTLSKRLN